jgi:hypothetical protein
MTPLEKYEAALAVLDSVSNTIVERYSGQDAASAKLDAALKARDAAIEQRDAALNAAEEWRKAYEDFAARAAGDAQRLSGALGALAGDRTEAAPAPRLRAPREPPIGGRCATARR